MKQSVWRALLPTWLVTAAWDFVCATVLAVVGYGLTFSHFWQGVASVPFGPAVFNSGARGVMLGLVTHLCVALAWSTVFIVALALSPRLQGTIERPAGAIAVAAVYGPLIWLVMSLGVIHMATGKMPVFNFRWWVQVFAHIPFVAIPLVFTARFFTLWRPTPRA